MRASDHYRIVDEPGPGTWDRWIVNPMWPLFATMFAGQWLGLPWFLFNSFALQGRGRWQDLGVVAAGFVTQIAAVLAAGLVILASVNAGSSAGAYALLVPLGIKLGLAYVLFLRQSPLFEIHRSFGGEPRNAVAVVVVGFIARNAVLESLPGWLPEWLWVVFA